MRNNTDPDNAQPDVVAVQLASHGKMDLEEAAGQVARWTHEVDTSKNQIPLFDVKALFKQLRSMNIKVYQ